MFHLSLHQDFQKPHDPHARGHPAGDGCLRPLLALRGTVHDKASGSSCPGAGARSAYQRALPKLAATFGLEKEPPARAGFWRGALAGRRKYSFFFLQATTICPNPAEQGPLRKGKSRSLTNFLLSLSLSLSLSVLELFG